MTNDLFITGASGYLGQRLLARLEPAGERRIVCLSRRKQPHLERENVRVVCGDLLEPASYASWLEPRMTVLHLAAVTGKARPAEYRRGNVEATDRLIGVCRQKGARRFLYVSSVAAKFEKLEHYHYGRSKKIAEQRVLASGLDALVVRPTMIFGGGAPVLEGLIRLASLPLVPVFGDGKVRVQPVHVDDLAGCLLSLAAEEVFDGRVIEVGGPEVISIEDLLARIHRRRTGKSPVVVHLPLRLLIPVLALLERVLLPILPLTAGQLASFRNDGVTEAVALRPECGEGMKSLDQMLESAFA